MSWRLRKNFSIGMRRFSRCWSTMMSTHDWWLQLTMYHARYSSSSSPATDHSVRWVRRIQPLLPATQRVAIPFSARSIFTRMGLTGMASLTSASTKISEHQKSVLIPSSSAETTPRTWKSSDMIAMYDSSECRGCRAAADFTTSRQLHHRHQDPLGAVRDLDHVGAGLLVRQEIDRHGTGIQVDHRRRRVGCA